MSLFVLDTDILTLFQDGHVAVQQHVIATAPADVAITVLSVEAQLSGWYTYIRRAKQVGKLAMAYQSLADNVISLRAFHIIGFDVSSIHRYESLRKLKLGVRKMDLRIAAIALEKNATIVTRNLRDFKQIAGLAVEDWSQ
jgi:tRNA(fMet)-specific endonuclease VapC